MMVMITFGIILLMQSLGGEFAALVLPLKSSDTFFFSFFGI